MSVSKKIEEKNITLNVALLLREFLNKQLADWRILLTRSTDEFLQLSERSQFANRNNGDLFISLHCNSGHKTARGHETYIFSMTEDDETERTVRLLENSVAEKFNLSSRKKNNPVDFITTDLAQINHLSESAILADLIQKHLCDYVSSENRGVKKARFYVLKDTFMPSALIELGFLSNEYDEKLLINETYQQKLARAIADAIIEYSKKNER